MSGFVHAAIRRRLPAVLALTAAALSGVPAAAAHGGVHVGIPQWAALVPLGLGVALVASALLLRRTKWADRPTAALSTVFAGVVFVALGAIGLVQLSPIAVPPIRYSPVARDLYLPISLALGVSIVAGSLLAGRFRWPTRPRYAALGVTLGLWVAYPALSRGTGMGPLAHPLGYVIVGAVPVLVGYVLHVDAAGTIRQVVADPVSRWFGAGVATVVAVFFMFSTGMLTIVPDDGVGLSHTESLTAVLPVKGPLVYWPAFEFWYPSVPLGGFLSVGMVLLVGLFALLVGLNAAFVAHQWRCRSGVNPSEGIAGSASLAAPNACCCCGPALAQLAVVALGPTTAAPFYWLFVDIASPVGALFFVASVALLTGNVVRFADTPLGAPDGGVSEVPSERRAEA